jgi:hypothetical protein
MNECLSLAYWKLMNIRLKVKAGKAGKDVSADYEKGISHEKAQKAQRQKSLCSFHFFVLLVPFCGWLF